MKPCVSGISSKKISHRSLRKTICASEGARSMQKVVEQLIAREQYLPGMAADLIKDLKRRAQTELAFLVSEDGPSREGERALLNKFIAAANAELKKSVLVATN